MSIASNLERLIARFDTALAWHHIEHSKRTELDIVMRDATVYHLGDESFSVGISEDDERIHVVVSGQRLQDFPFNPSLHGTSRTLTAFVNEVLLYAIARNRAKEDPA